MHCVDPFFFSFYLGHQVRHNYQCAPEPALAAKQNGDLFSLHPHPRFATLFLLAARTLGFSRRSSCRQVRYGLVFLGFVHRSLPFSGTGRNPRDCLYILCMIEQSRSKDPWAVFGGNWAALQRNQVHLW